MQQAYPSGYCKRKFLCCLLMAGSGKPLLHGPTRREWTLTVSLLEAVVLLHNTCIFDLSLSRTKSKAVEVSCSHFLSSSVIFFFSFFFFFYFFFKSWCCSWTYKYASLVPSVFLHIHPNKYSSILTMLVLGRTLHTVFWPCLYASLMSHALIPGSHLSHGAVPSCATSLGAVPCMSTLVLAASSPHLLFSCSFMSSFLLKQSSCTTSFLLMWSLPLYSPPCRLPVLLKTKRNFCSFVPSSQILILCVFTHPSYTSLFHRVLYSTNPRMVPRLRFVNLLNFGCEE